MAKTILNMKMAIAPPPQKKNKLLYLVCNMAAKVLGFAGVVRPRIF